MTVALGPAGNNFIMGGKHTSFSAEDAYTVRPVVYLYLLRLTVGFSIASHNTGIRQGCCV